MCYVRGGVCVVCLVFFLCSSVRVFDLLNDDCVVFAAKIVCQERQEVASDGSCEGIQRQESAPNGLWRQDVLKGHAICVLDLSVL